MPALPVTLMRWGEFDVEVAADGLSFGVLCAGRRWWRVSQPGLVPVEALLADVDEVEHSFVHAMVAVGVRHAVGGSWTLRWVVENPSAGPVRVPPLTLLAEPGGEATVWSWAAGAEGRIVLAPRSGRGSVVVLRLASGWLGAVPGGWRLTPDDLRLSPGGRYLVVLRGEVLASLDEVAAGLPEWLPALECPAGEPWELAAPDLAVTAPPWVSVTDTEAGAIVTGAAGRHPTTVHSVRGRTVLDVSLAPSLDVLLARAAADVLAAEGSVSAAEECLLAEAAARRLCSPAEVLSRLGEGWLPAPEALSVAAAARLSLQLGSPALLAAAVRALDGAGGAPGWGLVAALVRLAGLALPGAPDPRVPGEGDPLELCLLSDGAEPMLEGVVTTLGGPLPGEPFRVAPQVQARLAGLLLLCPEHWAVAERAASVATKTRLRLRASLVDDASPETLAWLAIGDALC